MFGHSLIGQRAKEIELCFGALDTGSESLGLV